MRRAAFVLTAFLCGCGEKPTTMRDLNAAEVTLPNGTKILAESMRDRVDMVRGLMFRDSLAADLAAMHRATDSRARSLEARIVGPQRVLTQVALTVAASRGSAGQPTELHWLLIDVTGQKRTEEALQVAEEKFRTIFEGSLDAVAIIRMADGTFADVNAECSRFTGFSRAEVQDEYNHTA